MMGFGALGCLVWLAASGGAAQPIVEPGASTCPTASEVQGALRGLIREGRTGDAAAAPNVVRLFDDAGGAVVVTLSKSTGAVIGRRQLPASLSCRERARAAAVVVAAWEVELRAGAQPPLPVGATSPRPSTAPAPIIADPAPVASPSALPPLPPSVPSPTPAPTPTPSPTPASTLPAPERAGPRDPVPVAARTLPPPPLPPPAPMQLELGAALLASVAAGDVAPALRVELALTRPGSRYGAGVSALAVGTHDTAVGAGRGSWRRFGALLDLRTVAGVRSVDLELHAGLALTALAIAGQALPVTAGATLFDPGALVAVRARFRLAGLSPWVDAAVALWPRAHSLSVNGVVASADLPMFEALLGLGVAFGRDR